MLKTFSIRCALLVVALSLCSCGNQEQSNLGANQAGPSPAASQSGPQKIKLTSAAFIDGAAIPSPYTCEGANVSPPLAWDTLPASARTLALIADDPDAPGGTWTHWVYFNLPASVKALTENVPAEERPAVGGMQGANDFRKTGYGGPCPPSGTHRYFFKLYALDTALSLASGATKDQVLKAMQGHIVAEGQLIGTYSKR